MGAKNVTESAKTGWDLTNIACTGSATTLIGSGQGNSFSQGFFFSSRRRHTTYIGDWSSDVCSSDLYTNTKHASLTVNKTAVGGDSSFSYTTSGGGLGSFSPI